MAILQKLQEALDRNGVNYTHHEHPIAYTAKEVANLEHLPQHRFAKAVVFAGDEGFAMAALPADFVVDLQELRGALGLKRARLATERELAELFPDCELGAMPPIGALYKMDTYVESSLTGEEWIAFNAGTHRDVVHMRLDDFKSLANPVVVHFARLTAA
ncbi:MAG: YbaK/EbsC family protein [Bryobacteraceae bacterium]|nr:YbaK/EbsC family protein [Bryobacteraceae bacterium]